MQAGLYSFFSPLQRLSSSTTLFMVLLSLSCGVSIVLIKNYKTHKDKTGISNSRDLIFFVFSTLSVVGLTVLLGELMLVVDIFLLISFLIILIITGKEIIFAGQP